MVDFRTLSATAVVRTPATLLETFSRLDRQVTHVELRPSQIRVLNSLDSRLSESDVVVKLSTGGGKTTIGLIYLKHQMELLRKPVVYLVPTIQLVEQVVSEGRKIGFPVCHWASGESYPPVESLEGKAAIVCTYDKFFNGKSTFARHDVLLVPGAIVLDDVHAGIESVRKCFSAELSVGARTELLGLLTADIVGADPTKAAGVVRGEASAVLDVPHWIVASQLASIRAILARHSGEGDLLFSWRYLSPMLEQCRIVISGTSAQISIDPSPVQLVQHYREAQHRLFMSASIHDAAVLIRELDCDPHAAGSPIEISEDSSVGERMVIVPSLINTDFAHDELVQVAFRVATVANVVVLVPSFPAAALWERAGAVVAHNQSISAVIDQLKSTRQGNVVVFAQRYDGVDLPDHACRLLIIDGLPHGDSLTDRADHQMSGGVVGVRGKVATRIEQGLGRAVRSASDYCAVLLSGRDVASFVSRSAVLENFSPPTVRQIEVGKRVSSAIGGTVDRVAGIVDTVMQCLKRDPDWKNYYSQQMAEPSSIFDGIRRVADTKMRIATLERKALVAGLARDFTTAHLSMQSAADACEVDTAWRGVLKQAAAKYRYLVDPVEAMQLQVSAYGDNYSVARPPTMAPRLARRITSQAEIIVEWLTGFDDRNGALIEIDDLATHLSFASATDSVEAAVHRLGELIGAHSTRPEKECGRGPDVLWQFDERAIVIEMKSAKVSPLTKSDAAQLQQSVLWVKENILRANEFFPVIGSNVVLSDRAGDFAFGVRVWLEEDFRDLIARFRALVVAAIAQGPLFLSNSANIQSRLSPHELLPSQILLRFRPPESK